MKVYGPFYAPGKDPEEEVCIVGEFNRPDIILHPYYQQFVKRGIRKNKAKYKLFRRCRVSVNNLFMDFRLDKLFKNPQLRLRKVQVNKPIYLKTWVHEVPEVPQLIRRMYFIDEEDIDEKIVLTHQKFQWENVSGLHAYRNWKHIDVSDSDCLEKPGACNHHVPHDSLHGAAVSTDSEDSETNDGDGIVTITID